MPTSHKAPSQHGRRLRFLAVALAGATGAASLTVASTASAGIIPESGWNLDNVTVTLDGTGSYFDPDMDPPYYFAPDSDYSYQAAVDNGAGDVMGIVLAKDWPIGEPPGIKIVNDDKGKIPDGRPTNCIMSTSYLDGAFLDSIDPQQVPCSGPFQSHKRFKVAMLPTTVAGGAGFEEGIDLVFDVDPEEGSRDYQVFQKINNWTDGRLDGFKIEVGTGIGTGFAASNADGGVGLTNLSLSVPDDFFDPNQLATFSQGLFGPEDTKHDRPPGFFDQTTRAGFFIDEAGILSGQTDTLTSGAPLGSDDDGGLGTYYDLFGPWLPNNMLPTGIFWDDDGNPDTDAQLVAWYGFNPVLGALGWMTGAAGGFAAIDDATIEAWGQNLEYTSGVIDDLVNVGLNYIVTVGDTPSFTIRITPSVDESGIGDPAFVGAPVTPPLVFAGSDGVVSISPEPTFPVGAVVTARVGDADLNSDPLAIEEVDVSINVEGGATGVLTLVELGPDRGVFAA
ncbi:MAG: choice-of-anchor F family protein, partial [Ilumatobacteraceae bacterium]